MFYVVQLNIPNTHPALLLWVFPTLFWFIYNLDFQHLRWSFQSILLESFIKQILPLSEIQESISFIST